VARLVRGHRRFAVSARLGDREQLPFPWHAFELVGAAVGELDPRADDEIAHRARHEHLAGCRPRAYARADVHGHAANVGVDQLTLTGVHAGAHTDAERADVLADRARAADRAGGTVERRQEAVAKRLDLVPAERCQLATHELIVAVEQRMPTVAAELSS